MEIKDVKPNTGKVDIIASVVTKEAPRTFAKFGKSGKVCNATLQDDSGKIVLTLWNDDVEKINVGDKVHLENGWCSEYKGEKQLSAGKFGKIEIVDGGKERPVLYTNDPAILSGNAPAAEESTGEEAGEADETAELDEEFVE